MLIFKAKRILKHLFLLVITLDIKHKYEIEHYYHSLYFKTK